MVRGAKGVVTDSGGIQEETSYLGVPCLTVRENTERPITITQGTNRLVASRRDNLVQVLEEVLSLTNIPKRKPELWDGMTAGRILQILRSALL